MSNGHDRPEELVARALVAKVTGAVVINTDVPTAPAGTVDARLDYEDGRVGALEISTLGSPQEFETVARIKRIGGHLPMLGKWKWLIQINDPDELPRVRNAYGVITRTCEHYRVSRLDQLPGDVIFGHPDLTWAYSDSSSEFFGLEIPVGARESSGRNDLTYYSPKAAYQVTQEDFVGELNEAFAGPVLAKRIGKLRKVTAEERHLFLRVSWSGLSDASWITLIQWSGEEHGIDPLPPPDLPAEITHLWLQTGWGGMVTRWVRHQGWDRPVM